MAVTGVRTFRAQNLSPALNTKAARAKGVAVSLSKLDTAVLQATKYPQTHASRVNAFKKAGVQVTALTEAFPQTRTNAELKTVKRLLTNGADLGSKESVKTDRLVQKLEKANWAMVVSVYDQVMGLKTRPNGEVLNGLRAHKITSFAHDIGTLQPNGRLENSVDIAVEKEHLWRAKTSVRSSTSVGGRGSASWNPRGGVGGRAS